jgi:hypothetical protein
MHWTVFRATEEEFLTSDAPVVKRDPGFRAGFHGGGLASSTAQVWFPLSKKACLLIPHDNERNRKFFELLENGKVQEAEATRAELQGCKFASRALRSWCMWQPGYVRSCTAHRRPCGAWPDTCKSVEN